MLGLFWKMHKFFIVVLFFKQPVCIGRTEDTQFLKHSFKQSFKAWFQEWLSLVLGLFVITFLGEACFKQLKCPPNWTHFSPVVFVIKKCLYHISARQYSLDISLFSASTASHDFYFQKVPPLGAGVGYEVPTAMWDMACCVLLGGKGQSKQLLGGLGGLNCVWKSWKLWARSQVGHEFLYSCPLKIFSRLESTCVLLRTFLTPAVLSASCLMKADQEPLGEETRLLSAGAHSVRHSRTGECAGQTLGSCLDNACRLLPETVCSKTMGGQRKAGWRGSQFRAVWQQRVQVAYGAKNFLIKSALYSLWVLPSFALCHRG